MNYFLHTHNTFPKIKIHTHITENTPYISKSFVHYLKINNDHKHLDFFYKNIYLYEYLKYCIPNNKIKHMMPCVFFELIEILSIFNIITGITDEYINCLHIDNKYSQYSFQMCYNIISNIMNINKKISHQTVFDIDENFNTSKKSQFIFIDCSYIDSETYSFNYTFKIILSLLYIFRFQSKNGYFIMKINCILHKPIIDVIFILCYLYNRVTINKPFISDPISNSRYIICENLIKGDECHVLYDNMVNNIHNIKNCLNLKTILFGQTIPINIINKIDESNVVIGQQKLEVIDQIDHNMHKIKEDKYNIFKKTNITRAQQWLKKYKLLI